MASSVTSARIVLVGALVSMLLLSASSQEFMSPNSAGLWGLNSRNRLRLPMMRRFDCSAICRKTGYSGYIGGCQCGFTLFTKRSKSAFDSISSPDDAVNSLPYALSSMEEPAAAASSSSSNDDTREVTMSRDNYLRSAPAYRSASVASSNGASRVPCVGLCDRSK